MTITVSRITVWRSGQVTFCSSAQASCENRTSPSCCCAITVPLHGRRDSNSQPLVLETSALPVELLPYAVEGAAAPRTPNCRSPSFSVRRVLAATRTELGELEPVRVVLPVLRRRVGPRAARRAGERDDRPVDLRHG